jgi:hypothetical protein
MHMVDMRKATITRSGLVGELSRVAKALQDEASFDIGAYAARWMIEPSEVIEQFFAIGESQPATDRGRGQRVLIPVSWIWASAQMDEHQGAGTIVESIRAIPGVEDITAPTRDTQLGVIWSVNVTIRTSQ